MFLLNHGLPPCISEYNQTAQNTVTAQSSVHKSKGLEYDTMIFIGLDDENWWSHSRNNPDGLATFFVALSRAKQRALFTFCRERGEPRLIEVQ